MVTSNTGIHFLLLWYNIVVMMCDGISQHDLEQNTIASLPPSIHALLLAQVGKLVQEQVDETRLEAGA